MSLNLATKQSQSFDWGRLGMRMLGTAIGVGIVSFFIFVGYQIGHQDAQLDCIEYRIERLHK